MNSPNELSACEAARRIAAGTLTAEALVRACLDRIGEREAVVGAWEHLDPAGALAAAAQADGDTAAGVLRGIPIGVKDVIDTFDMPTGYGSPIYAGHRPAADAACVALAREAGGVILGKTVTTEFAHRVPGRTRHPFDPDRTPGGSSSGSAAAVADCMVPLAIGTQTTASTTRPASFCGVVGYRPTFGDLPVSGLRLCSESFDTLGLIARTVGDVAFFRDALLRRRPEPPSAPAGGLRIGFCRTPFWDALDPGTGDLLEDAAERLGRAGARLQSVELAPEAIMTREAHRVVSAYELARNLSHERRLHADALSQVIKEGKIAEGLRLDHEDHATARRILETGRLAMDGLFDDIDILVTPAAAGEAPVGLQSTGTPVYSVLWTALHVPSITVPGLRGPAGMPIGVQLVARRGADDRLLAAAAWVEAHLV